MVESGLSAQPVLPALPGLSDPSGMSRLSALSDRSGLSRLSAVSGLPVLAVSWACGSEKIPEPNGDENPTAGFMPGSVLEAPPASRSADRENGTSEERFIPLTLSSATDISRPKSVPFSTPGYGSSTRFFWGIGHGLPVANPQARTGIKSTRVPATAGLHHRPPRMRA